MDTDIVILGGGIAGSALACALRNSGYRIALVEPRVEALDTARGDHLQPCNVEALAKWGALDAFFAAGAGKRWGHEFRDASGGVLLSARCDELPIPFGYFLVYDHARIAELFQDLASSSKNFRRFRPANVRGYEITANGVESVDVEEPGGAKTRIRASVVVGSDGAQSPLRTALKFTSDDYVYRHPMVALFGPRPAGLYPLDYFFRYSSASGVLVIQQRMDGSIKVTLPIGEEGIPWWRKSTASERSAALAKRAGVLEAFDSEIGGFYPVKRIHVHEYVKGNVVLVGDAAHAMHPARGQGLNMGIASLPRLIECLPPPDRIGDPAAVRAALARYQGEQKPLYDRILARNHEAALAMESTADGDAAAAIAMQDHQIRRIHQTPELRKRHLLEAAGYPFGYPAGDVDLQA